MNMTAYHSALASPSPAHLFADFQPDGIEAAILDEWTWLIGTQKRPIRITACGDAFIEDTDDGRIHFLDVNAAALTPVADTAAALEVLLSTPSFIEAYLHPERVASLRAHGDFLEREQVYSFTHPLALGGEYSVDNSETCDAEVHFSISGQIARQIAELPEGGVVTDLKIAPSPRTKPWWRFW